MIWGLFLICSSTDYPADATIARALKPKGELICLVDGTRKSCFARAASAVDLRRACSQMRMMMSIVCVLTSTFAADARDLQTKWTLSTPRNATIYFLRPDAFITPSAPDIKVDGMVVGKLAGGTYFLISRPPGHHTIEIKDSFLDGGWESKVEWAPGQTYFIEIGPVQTYGIAYRALIAMLSNTRGRQMAGSGILAKFSFFTLDAVQGRDEIAKIKSAAR
jgi:hypothetical protein